MDLPAAQCRVTLTQFHAATDAHLVLLMVKIRAERVTERFRGNVSVCARRLAEMRSSNNQWRNSGMLAELDRATPI